MSKKSIYVDLPKRDYAAQDIGPAKAFRDAFEVSASPIMTVKIREIIEFLWFDEDASDEMKHARIVRALELYKSLEPADGAEGMLAMQMVGTHDAALQCLKRAALSSQTFEGRDVNLKHAQKLMTLYTQQLATLNKHRGKGQQKVTVEHVNVEAGGQAIVGSVEAGSAKRGSPTRKPDTLDHQEMPALDPEAKPKRAPAKKRRG